MCCCVISGSQLLSSPCYYVISHAVITLMLSTHCLMFMSSLSSRTLTVITPLRLRTHAGVPQISFRSRWSLQPDGSPDSPGSPPRPVAPWHKGAFAKCNNRPAEVAKLEIPALDRQHRGVAFHKVTHVAYECWLVVQGLLAAG